ncbi:hypothetical protein SAMD00019534_006970 [Acytostelium subglobosum LB1]|uniref:hypothetical protein n=1 Tax=Acytostelium subglobosum LB1 TaxID=1410327 RepID=UPI000644DCBA|nr:hypothetical protein SAMD00019534_006970 [Acytostelium subglobosum LB1]GAM17522.1 hypothetical protein SAMD00019534_006970 [Acytostelium subglobosum LB1]|eukprot:XP_012759584.1 hypothetical protein SAMD00019534_006970 [Acytostelium subglobosum LB1]
MISNNNGLQLLQQQQQDQDVMHPAEYFDYTLDLIKQVILEIKTLIVIHSNDSDNVDRLLNDASISAIRNINNVITLLEEFPFSLDGIEQHHSYLLESIKNLSSIIQQLIDTSKAILLNPYDFLTATNFKTTKSQSIEYIRIVLSAFESLKVTFIQVLEDEELASTPNSVSPTASSPDTSSPRSPIQQPQYLAVATTSGSSSHGNNTRDKDGRPRLSPQNSSQDLDNEVCIKVEKCAVNLIHNINKLTEACIEEDFKGLLAAVKAISNDITTISKEMKIQKLEYSLKDSATEVITLSKLVLKNKNDPHYVQELEVAVAKLNDNIKKVIHATKHNSMQLNASTTLSEELGLDTASNDSDSPKMERVPPLVRERSLKTIEEEKMLEFEKARKDRELEQQEEDRKKKAEQERIDNENLEMHILRLEKERLEKERVAKEKEERERLEKEQQKRERDENERLEKERLEKDRQEKARLVQLDQERTEKERQEREKNSVVRNSDIKDKLTKIEKEKIETRKSPSISAAPAPSPSLTTSGSKQSQQQNVLTPPTSPTSSKQMSPMGSESPSMSDSMDKSKSGKEGNKTFGKFLSKIVRNKKRQPMPFDQSLSTPASPSSPSSPQSGATSPLVDSTKSRSVSTPVVPQSNSVTVSVSVPKVSFSPSVVVEPEKTVDSPRLLTTPGRLPLPSSPSKMYLRKQTERSLNIGMVNGKPSPKDSLQVAAAKKAAARRSTQYSIDHSVATSQIINILMKEYPEFAKQSEANLESTSDKILAVIKKHAEECITNNMSQPGASGNVRASQMVINKLNNMRQELANEAHNDSQYQTMTLRYKMTRKLSTIKKKNAPGTLLDGSTSRTAAQQHIDKVNQELVGTTTQFVDEIIELVDMAYQFSTDPTERDTSSLKDPVESVYKLLSVMLDQALVVGRIDEKSFLSTQIKSTKKLVDSSMSRGPGKINASIYSCATTNRQFIERNLDRSIVEQCNAVRVVAIQMTTIIIGISSKPWDVSVQLQLFATANSFCEGFAKLLDNIANKIFVKALPKAPTAGSESDDLEVDLAEPEDDDVNIWKENSANLKSEWISDDGSKTGRLVLKSGSLNKLIESLTSEKPYDNSKFTRTFLMTYMSFTTPRKLFDKLVQRYTVPEDRDKTFRESVQVRVASFINSWVERNFGDFDSILIDRIKTFANNRLLTDEHGDLARLLRATIDQRVTEESERSKQLINQSFPEPMIPEGQKSPSTLLLLLNDSEIARQLTIIEAGIFGRINPREFQEQSWSKEHLKPLSPNIMDLINRANKFSFWVASQILWQEDVESRVRVIEKFLNIAKFLREMNNFNTALNIFAGLNQSSINRLKKTFAQVSQPSLAIYTSLEKLMNSTGSYKTYRQALKAATNPCLPYLPVILSDLTFMEDGNPDMIGNLINFQKRELIYRAISEVQTTQQVKYDFPIVEPIHTLLLELPSSSSDELYQLSLMREPREGNNTGGSGGSSMSQSQKK